MFTNLQNPLRIKKYPHLLTALLLLSLLQGRCGNLETVRLGDNSDWWSVFNVTFQRPKVKRAHIDTSEANFEVLGVRLGKQQFREFSTKLGEARIVERGKSAAHRSQVCYTSAGGPDVYFAAELGGNEYYTNYALYLFLSGENWSGKELCTRSPLVSHQLSTASGVHLGQSPSEVEAILGKPEVFSEDKFVYDRYVIKKTPQEELNSIKANSTMSKQQLEDTYGSYGLRIYIEARFVNSHMTYLAVSKSESF